MYAAPSARLKPDLGRRPAIVAAGSPDEGRGASPALELLSLKNCSAEHILVIAWVVSTRVFTADAAKFGVHVGSVPLFWTDFVLLGLLALTLAKRPARLLVWFSSGTGAGSLGRPVWLLVIAAIVYFEAAFPEHGIFAARDLAIFGYSLFYPLTYWTLRSRFDAVRLARYFVYAGVIPAAVAIFDLASGAHFLLIAGARSVFSNTLVNTIGGGDFGGICAFSLAGLIAYAAVERPSRTAHLCLAAVSLLGLVAATTRSATLGFVAAVALSALLQGRFRLWVGAAAVIAVLAGLLAMLYPHDYAGNGFFGRYLLAVGSGFAGATSDADAAFRLVRWRYTLDLWRRSPLLGIGFGAPLLPSWIAPEEFQAGLFNGGMPHNTFLFVMARMGLAGIGIIAYAWLLGLARAVQAFRLTRRGDELAVANILIAMLVFAAFVLFFERPVNGPALWIMLAVAVRLSEESRRERRTPRSIHAAANLARATGASSFGAQGPAPNAIRTPQRAGPSRELSS
jgi:O-antigen ligase